MSILRFSTRWTAIVALASVFVSANVRAEIITLNVNAALSNIRLAGSAFGLTYSAQPADVNLTENLAGTITADLTAGLFTFAGGSTITFGTKPNLTYFGAGAALITESGNYGVTTSGSVIGSPINPLRIDGVYKNMVLDITGGTAQNGVSLASTMRLDGILDFGAVDLATLTALIQTGNSPFANITGTNNAAVTWDGTTLTIPVAFSTVTGQNRVENWSGTIIAAVPEPSSIALMSLVGFVGLSYSTVRSRRAKRLLNS